MQEQLLAGGPRHPTVLDEKEPCQMLLDARVRKRQLIGDTVLLEIVARNGEPLPAFTAGAHIDLHLEGGIIRQYSLCNAPDQPGYYLLGVLQDPRSRGGSAAVHKNLHEGRELKIGLPRNNFELVEGAAHSILLGGGIGVTPLLAMAWRLHSLHNSFELHYFVRTLGGAAFTQYLQTTPFADRVSIHPDDCVPRFDVSKLLAHPENGTHLYICGPTGFMDFITEQSAKLDWPGAQVHLERFSATINGSGGAFRVRCARSRAEVTVPEGVSIAAALLAAGIEVPLSCEQGICGTCVTGVLEGIPDHRDLFLLDDEKQANNLITLCCSRSTSPLLVLDL